MLETHPFPPYLPPSAKVLIMGTFPPQPHRWAMEFYYPNRTKISGASSDSLSTVTKITSTTHPHAHFDLRSYARPSTVAA